MLLLKYYRLYLWIFLYSFFTLILVAISVDCAYSSATEGEVAKVRFPRFQSALICFIFASLSLYLQHKISYKLMNVDLLSEKGRKQYAFRYMTQSVFTKKKTSALWKKSSLVISHWLYNMINLAPIMIWSVFVLTSLEEKMNNINLIDSTFFAIGCLVRYIAWYLTLLTSKLFVFKNQKRLRIVE